MKSIKAALASLLRTPQVNDFVDPVLGVLAWQPSMEAWVSGQLAQDRPFHFRFIRQRKAASPEEECLLAARAIALSPGTLEEQVRLQLAYATSGRSEGVRSGVSSLKICGVVFRLELGRVSGEVLLGGDPSLSSWTVWHESGIPSLAAQHWE